MFSGIHLFVRAYNTTKHQIGVSLKVLALVTLGFATLLFFAEHSVNEEYNFWDALVWTFVKYVEDPADIVSGPLTIPGKIIGTLVGVLGIAIFAVPAGLIGSGLMDAMETERHDKEVENNYHRLRKAFRRETNRSLRAHLNTLPDKGGKAFAKLNVVPQYVPASRVQIRQGMDIKDVFEVCERYPEFRMKNLAEALSEEDRPEDRFVVSTFPMNTSYGCCIDRGSKVTIVCPVGFSEVGTGWFSYYLAKFGGFNYVCKELEVDADELDSFYNMSEEPLYDKKKREEYVKSKNKHAIRIIEEKEKRRADFIADIKKMNRGEDSWIIMVAAQIKSSENGTDFHFAHCKKDGSQSTLNDCEAYKRLFARFDEEMKGDLGLTSVDASQRFPFISKNLAYRLQGKEGLKCSVFALRPSTQLMIFDIKKLLYAYRAASIFSEELDNGKGVEKIDAEDFASSLFGYSENILK